MSGAHAEPAWTRPTDHALPRALELLDVDTAAGVARWKAGNGSRSGQVAGNVEPNGYRRIRFEGKRVRVHRLVWFAHYGTPPPETIDHENMQRTNGALSNAIGNLREATHAENLANCKPRRINTTGFPGVHRVRDKFRAAIKQDGRNVHIGNFACPVLAWCAFVGAKQKQHGPFARCDLPGRIEAMHAIGET